MAQVCEYPAVIAVMLPHGSLPGTIVAVLVDVRDLVRVLVRVGVCVTVADLVGVLVRVGVCVGVGGTQPEPTSVGTLRLTVSQTPIWPTSFQPQQ